LTDVDLHDFLMVSFERPNGRCAFAHQGAQIASRKERPRLGAHIHDLTSM
jgi:hypothetical protein